MARNPLRVDPSRTGLIRRQFIADLHRRFATIRSDVWQLVAVEDAFGLNKPDPAARGFHVNAPNFKFDTVDKKLKGFNKWLQDRINDRVLEAVPGIGEPKNLKPWMYKYIASAYRTGVVRAYIDAKPNLHIKKSGYNDTQAGFLQSAFGRPERLSKVAMLYTRAYENLKGITGPMSAQMSRVLADGMANGLGPMQVARTLSKTISGIDRSRAETIARTEIIHAHSEGQLDAFDDLGVEDVGIEAEWLTAGDDAVCPKCKAMSGKVMTVDEARGLLPLHPNCRCAWIPYVGPPKGKRK